MEVERENSDSWWIYVIACRGGGLYWGIAKNVEARYRVHVSGKGALYTRLHPPVEIVATKCFDCHRDAAIEERRIKRMKTHQRLEYARTLVRSERDSRNAGDARNNL